MKYKLKVIKKKKGWGATDPRTKEIMSSYDHCKQLYSPALNQSGVLMTGLVDNDRPDPKTGEVHPLAIKRQDLENMLGLAPGTLYKGSIFWQNDFPFPIPSRGVEIDTEDALGELRYIVLSSDPEVALTLEDVEKKTKCKWSLLTDQAVSKEKNVKRSVKFKAIAALQKLTATEVINVLALYNIDGTDTDSETNFDILSDYVEKNPEGFLSKATDPDLKVKAAINIALKKGIITREGINDNSVHRFMGNDIGFGIENVISFVKAKENQSIWSEIQKEIKK